MNRFAAIPCEGISDQDCVRRFLARIAEADTNGCQRYRSSSTRVAHRLFAGGPWYVPSSSGRRRRRSVLAHRFMWELQCGPIPDGLVLRHRCDVPDCCTIEHLELGTDADNVADRAWRWTSPTGAQGNGRAKLSYQQVREIFLFAWQGQLQQQEIADRYGISRPHVAGIKRGAFGRYAISGLAGHDLSALPDEARRVHSQAMLALARVPA